jgi:hypothetical protein
LVLNHRTGNGDGPELRLTLQPHRDVYGVELGEKVLAFVKSKYGGEGWKWEVPEIDDEKWEIQLRIRTRDVALGKMQTLKLDTEAKEGGYTLAFRLSEQQAALYEKSSPGDISVRVSNFYPAQVVQTDFSITTRMLDRSARTFMNRMKARPDGPAPKWIIPVGGSVEQRMDVSDFAYLSVILEVARYESGKIDTNLLVKALELAFHVFKEQFRGEALAEQKEDTLVSFVLENGFRMTTALNEYNKLYDEFAKDKQQFTHDLLMGYSKKVSQDKEGVANSNRLTEQEQHALNVAFAAGGDFLGIISADMSGNLSKADSQFSDRQSSHSRTTDYFRLDEEAKRQARDDFSRAIETGKQYVEGKLKGVMALNGEQFLEMERKHVFEGEIKQVTIRDINKEYVLRMAASPRSSQKKQVAAQPPQKLTIDLSQFKYNQPPVIVQETPSRICQKCRRPLLAGEFRHCEDCMANAWDVVSKFYPKQPYPRRPY